MTTLPAQTFHPPPSTAAETLARETFQALLGALSNPGRIFTLPGAELTTRQSCAQIGMTLLDLESSFYTADHSLRPMLAQSGARFRTPASAAYLFLPDPALFEPMMLRQTLDIMAQASVGTITDPDEGATLIVGCAFAQGQRLWLRGPGIQQTAELSVEHLPVEFWRLRADQLRYPLGIDIFLVAGRQIVGLPRTTTVEIE
jgi:alpha-D-ribose 1-methylphosphonate 5-triphosphate synthase subunit PhnH